MNAKLIPEREVEDLDRSLAFYTGIIGCAVLYARPEERFVFLELEGANVMLEEAAGPGRRFHGAPLEHPFGRGVNFQIQVVDVDGLYARVLAAQSHVVMPMEDRWYRRDDHEIGNRQFVVADPDGYLLRFFTALGQRLLAPHPGRRGDGSPGKRQA
jgi:catechol 2,3-dioxygenase-like lactoylglutathione lyase family enzyme